jgi:hypothetical protein
MDKTITYHCGLFWESLADGHSEQANFDILDRLARGDVWWAEASLGHTKAGATFPEKSIRGFLEIIRAWLDVHQDVIVQCRAGDVCVEFINA